MATSLKVGLLITGMHAADTVRAAQAGERYGHDGFWLVEDLWNRGAVPLAAACAMATERLRIGVGVVNPYTRHPTLYAMDYGTLAELSRGRVILGIGASVEAWINQMGLEYRLPRTSVKESVEIARELLDGQTSNYQGSAFQINNVRLSFTVAYPMPMYVAAMGERTVRTCGEIADGWVVSLLEPVGYIRHAMAWLREGAARARRDASEIEVVQYFPFSCADNSRDAKRAVKPLMALFLAGEFGLYEQQEPVMKSLRDYLDTIPAEEYHGILRKLVDGGEPEEIIPDALVDELAIAGTPEECAAKLRAYAHEGVTEAALLPASNDIEGTARVIGELISPLL